MPLAVGTQAPDFTLKSKSPNDAEVKLSSNLSHKNTVILFFPLAFTGVCTTEMCDLSSGLADYASLNAEVIAISVDSPFAQHAWAEKNKITVRIASDLNKSVTQAYQVLFPNLAGIGDTSARAAFVVDRNGVIQYSEQTATPKDLPDFEAIKAVLATLG